LLSSLIVLGYATHDPIVTCGAVGLAFGMHSIASMVVVSRRDGVPMKEFVGQCAPPLLATVPMAVAVVLTRVLFHGAALDKEGVLLVVELLVGGITYVASSFVVARSTVLDFVRLVRGALLRRSGEGDRISDAPVSTPAAE
jgi:PST family polysaccharide transporter